MSGRLLTKIVEVYILLLDNLEYQILSFLHYQTVKKQSRHKMKTDNSKIKQDHAELSSSSMSVSMPVAFFKQLTGNPHNTTCFSVKGIVVGIIIIISLIIIG